MSEKYFENFWDCQNCGTANISALRKMRCPNCGGSKPTQDFENSRMVEITDEHGLKLAKSGKNWACSYCQSVSLDTDQKCSGCSADRSEAVAGAFRVEDVTEKVKKCNIVESDSTPDSADRSHDFSQQERHVAVNEANNLDDAPAYRPSSHYERRWESTSEPTRVTGAKRITSQHWAIIGVVAVVLAISGFVYWTKRSYPGELASFYWERSAQVEIYKTLSDNGWDHPSDAFNVNSRSKVHHYDPIYENRTVTEQEPYTVTVYVSQTRYVSNGNGSTKSVTTQVPQSHTEYRTVTRSRQVKVGENPIYRTYYEYNINRWVYHDTLHSSGENKNKIYWPEFTPGNGGVDNLGATRLGSRNETLYVYATWKLGEENKHDKFKVSGYEGLLIGRKLHVHYLLGVPTSIEFDLNAEAP